MTETFDIRQATPADYAELLPLHRALYIDLQGALLPPQVARLSAYRDFERVLSDDLRGLLSGPPSLVLMSPGEHGAVGYISGQLQLEPGRVLTRRAVIEDWFVRESARGTGVGRALFEHFEAAMRDRGAELIETTTWAPHAEARARYARLGFDEVQVVLRRPL